MMSKSKGTARLLAGLFLCILSACSEPTPITIPPDVTLIPPTRTRVPIPSITPFGQSAESTLIPTDTEAAPSATLTLPAPPTEETTATLEALIDEHPEIRVDDAGISMVLVPEGEFIMGFDAGERDERPVHTVFLDTFYIDQFEVTNAAYADFLNEVGNQIEFSAFWLEFNDPDVRLHEVEGVWIADSGFETHPVIEMTWFGARAYCDWRDGRLPSEAEWEKAARGPEGSLFPWGNDTPTCEMANFATCVRRTVPVGSYPANVSIYGAFDMAGNVWEWVNDWWDPEYYTYTPLSNPTGPELEDFKVRRGGGYDNNADHLRATFRYHNLPPLTFKTIGLRCAASP
jgi:formylglycine-generating enzyme required for sulfatase activity